MLLVSIHEGKPSVTKKRANLFFPPGIQDDFPLTMQISYTLDLLNTSLASNWLLLVQPLALLHPSEEHEGASMKSLDSGPYVKLENGSTIEANLRMESKRVQLYDYRCSSIVEGVMYEFQKGVKSFKIDDGQNTGYEGEKISLEKAA
ncbi:unnamed protein product [Lactuca virosa]|uniref:Uncharacterized protein n=1 Tax=Lactuca virosa TaxID=75947 RepID=A0AAU9MTF7_9ASTR|nr:unnamed protein product [Lactuca virosa]